MPGWGAHGQAKLARAQVFVAGAGGLGCAASLYLAAAGVGRLIICDNDLIEASNLNRQILYSPADIGREKAPVAVQRLRALNPSIAVEPRTAEIGEQPAAGLIRGTDVILDCLDSLETRFALNRAAMAARIPMVYAAVSDFTGYLSFLNPPTTPCLECFVPRTPPEEAPTVPGCTVGLLGSLEAMEAIKFLTGIGENLTNRLLVVEGAEPRFDIVAVERDPTCEACRDLR